ALQLVCSEALCRACREGGRRSIEKRIANRVGVRHCCIPNVREGHRCFGWLPLRSECGALIRQSPGARHVAQPCGLGERATNTTPTRVLDRVPKPPADRKSTRPHSSHVSNSYPVF